MIIPIRRHKEMSVKDQDTCVEFSKHLQYLLDKYYQKTEFPSLINETCFAVMARVLQLYQPDQRAFIIGEIAKLANPDNERTV